MPKSRWSPDTSTMAEFAQGVWTDAMFMAAGNEMSWIDQRPDDAMAGAFEAIGPEPFNSVEAAAFREAMCRLRAAGPVVTHARAAGPTGLTADPGAPGPDPPPAPLG